MFRSSEMIVQRDLRGAGYPARLAKEPVTAFHRFRVQETLRFARVGFQKRQPDAEAPRFVFLRRLAGKKKSIFSVCKREKIIIREKFLPSFPLTGARVKKSVFHHFIVYYILMLFPGVMSLRLLFRRKSQITVFTI